MRPWAEISADFEGVSAPGSPPPVRRQSGRRLRSPRWKTGDPWWAVRPREITIDGRRTVTYPVCAMAAVMGRTSATIRRWETVGILPPAPIVEPGVSWQGDRRLYRRAHIEAAERIGQEERIVDAKVAAFRRSLFPARMRVAYVAIDRQRQEL